MTSANVPDKIAKSSRHRLSRLVLAAVFLLFSIALSSATLRGTRGGEEDRSGGPTTGSGQGLSVRALVP